MPGPVAGDPNSVVPAGCPENLWINCRNSRKAKVLAVPVGGLNGSVGCEKLEIHSTVAYVTTHASNLNTKSVEAQQEEEDEQCEVEEVSDQGFDEYTEITAPQMCPDKA